LTPPNSAQTRCAPSSPSASTGEIYNWFTEGFDLPDLKDAKALLDELSC
jgi:hypothetical protein